MMRVKLYFSIMNIAFLVLALWFILPERLSELRSQADIIALRERQLATLELNYLMYEENLLALTEIEMELNSAGRTGEILMYILVMLRYHDLIEIEFNSNEYADHSSFIETRIAISCEGSYRNISAFLHTLDDYEHHIQIWQVQMSSEMIHQARQFRIMLSVFEEF